MNYSSSSIINTPFGPIDASSNDGSLNSNVYTPNGAFQTTSLRANSGETNPRNISLNSGVIGNAPTLSSGKRVANYSGPLTKVTLTSTDFPKGAKATLVLQFNPEQIASALPTRFGEYNGVLRDPNLYYSGRTADRMSIRSFITDRINGMGPWYDKLLQFAQPNGVGQQGTASKTQFSAPPLSFLNYGKFGTFKGYVEHPMIEPTMLDRDLKPLMGYISFTFVCIKRQPYKGQSK